MLNAQETLAIVKLFGEKDEKAAKDKLKIGKKYEVDTCVRIHGTIELSSYDKAASCSIPWMKALAIALHFAGKKKDEAIELIEKAVRESLDKGSAFVDLDLEKIEALEERIKNEIVAKLPKSKVVKTSVKVAYDKLEIENEPLIVRKAG
jgi:hypothetical protein